jgi:hypothetical protein
MPDNSDASMPRLLRFWPLAITLIAAAAVLVVLAALVRSDVTRVALPAIAGAVGTIALAAVTVRLSKAERAYQDQLRRAEAIAATKRERELEYADAVRQARRVAAFGGWEGPNVGGISTVTLVNGSDYPIFDIGLIGSRLEAFSGPVTDREWPPERRLEGDSLYVAVLLPGERHVFRGQWKWRKDFIMEGNTVTQQRQTYTWTDDQGRAWTRDGSEPPKPRSQPWQWMEFWGNAEYSDQPNIRP